MKTDPKLEDELFTDINDNVQRLQERIQFMVDGRRELKSTHSTELDEYEGVMLAFLWRCRTVLSTAKMARMIGLSRQALYTKWRKYGYNPTDESTASKGG